LTEIPDFDVDLFDPASLRNPYQHYRDLRDAGPVVRLRHPQAYAIGRFADVQAALRASEILISGEGVGFSDTFNAPKGKNVIQTDGDVHRRMRAAVTRPLTPARLKDARVELKQLISERVGELAGTGWFDAMPQLASYLPVRAIASLVGLPEDGREKMLEWAAAVFNLVGPIESPEDVARMQEAFGYIATLNKDGVTEGSWAAELFEVADSGRIALHEAVGAISAYVLPSLDTTISAKGHLLNNLALDPDQWAILRREPDRIPGAVLESMRHSAPLRWFARFTAQDYALDDMVIPAGERVMILYACANRDERRYPDPDRFDVRRDARDHLGWGTGPHMCAGMHLARIEMEVLLEALIETGVAIEAGTPVIGDNAGLLGFASLPLRLERTAL